jgi:hypothetical protein
MPSIMIPGSYKKIQQDTFTIEADGRVVHLLEDRAIMCVIFYAVQIVIDPRNLQIVHNPCNQTCKL